MQPQNGRYWIIEWQAFFKYFVIDGGKCKKPMPKGKMCPGEPGDKMKKLNWNIGGL